MDRQRDPVETTTYLDDEGPVRIGEREVAFRRDCTIDKQLLAFALDQRTDRDEALPTDPQPLPARRQHHQLGTRRLERPDQLRRSARGDAHSCRAPAAVALGAGGRPAPPPSAHSGVSASLTLWDRIADRAWIASLASSTSHTPSRNRGAHLRRDLQRADGSAHPTHTRRALNHRSRVESHRSYQIVFTTDERIGPVATGKFPGNESNDCNEETTVPTVVHDLEHLHRTRKSRADVTEIHDAPPCRAANRRPTPRRPPRPGSDHHGQPRSAVASVQRVALVLILTGAPCPVCRPMRAGNGPVARRTSTARASCTSTAAATASGAERERCGDSVADTREHDTAVTRGPRHRTTCRGPPLLRHRGPAGPPQAWSNRRFVNKNVTVPDGKLVIAIRSQTP